MILRDILILSISIMFMIAMLGLENIVKAFSGQYTCYTHLFRIATYQLGDKSSFWLLSKSLPTIIQILKIDF